MNQRHKVLYVAAILVAAIAAPASGAGTLVAHYEFEDADDLGNDSSGMGNHADEVFEVEQVDGQIGQGAFFDEFLGSSFIKFDGLDGFTGKPGVTLAAWVSLDEGTTGFDGIISQDAGGCCDNRILLHPDNTPFINLSEHDDRHLSSGPFFEFDEWMHIAMTGEDLDGGGSEARVYVNGEEVDDSPQEFPTMDDGSEWNTYLGAGESGNVHLLTGSLDDVRIYEGALTENEIRQLYDGGPVVLPGDFNENQLLDVEDMDLLTVETRAGTNDQAFDLNNDQLVDNADRTVWIKDLKNSYFGDANIDGEFNSGDLVSVFTAGEYEDGIAGNSTWGTGDWNGDGDFASGDIVAAFQDGGFELGPRGPAQVVPEPSACLLLIGFLFHMAFFRTREM